MTQKVHFGQSGWQYSPQFFPVISSEVILDHLLKTGKNIPNSKDTVVTQKLLKRRYEFFFWGHVHLVELQHSGVWFVQSVLGFIVQKYKIPAKISTYYM